MTLGSEKVMDYKEVIRNAASEKLTELAKEFLTILDELKFEDAAKVDKVISLNEDFEIFRPFLFLVDEPKKDILRKRTLDKLNKLLRELKK